MNEFRPVSKESQLHTRRKPKHGNATRITQRVREEVLRRSEGYCERCGKSSAYAFEMAHIVQASQLGKGSEPWNIALLCGPSVNAGTCHHEVDSTKEGRAWARGYRDGLIHYYKSLGKYSQ